MNVANPLKFGFDPRASDIPVLKTTLGQIVWGALRCHHVVDQYFNARVNSFVESIRETKPRNWKEFQGLAFCCGLGQLGLRKVPGSRSTIYHDATEPDPDYWTDVCEYARGLRILHFEFEGRDITPDPLEGLPLFSNERLTTSRQL